MLGDICLSHQVDGMGKAEGLFEQLGKALEGGEGEELVSKMKVCQFAPGKKPSRRRLDLLLRALVPRSPCLAQ